jgi:hypothetical protein
MKPRHYIALALTLVGVALVVAMLLLPRPLPPDECSDVYRQYTDTPGIKASFIKDYPLDDTTTIDVTSFTALDTTSWRWLRTQFGFGKPDFSTMEPGCIFSRIAPKGHYDQPTDQSNPMNNDKIIGSGYDRTIEIFHITDTNQIELFSKYMLNKIRESNKQH